MYFYYDPLKRYTVKLRPQDIQDILAEDADVQSVDVFDNPEPDLLWDQPPTFKDNGGEPFGDDPTNANYYFWMHPPTFEGYEVF